MTDPRRSVRISRRAHALALAAACTLALPLAAQGAVRAVPAKRTDTMTLKNHGKLLEIRSPSGVGSGQLVRKDGPWPASLTVRLKGLKAFEHFRMTAGDLSLVCALERLEGVASQRFCRLGGESVPGPVEVASGFEVTVPPELLANHEDSIVIEWVDSWR